MIRLRRMLRFYATNSVIFRRMCIEPTIMGTTGHESPQAIMAFRQIILYALFEKIRIVKACSMPVQSLACSYRSMQGRGGSHCNSTFRPPQFPT